MSTKYIASNWRLPNEENSNKSDNYGLSFTGTSEYINCGNISSLQNTNILSISMWFNLNTLTTQRMLGHYTTNNGLTIESDSNVIYFVIANGSLTYATLPISGNITTNTWFNIVMVYDGTQSSNATRLKAYLNNEEKSLSYVGTIPSSLAVNNSAVLGLGSTTPPTNVDMDGQLSEVAVFDYALSSTQISTLYGSSSLGAGNPMAIKRQPVGYWPLGDNSASNPLTQPNEAVEDASVFDFDGISQYIDCGDNDAFSFGNGTTDSPFSISAWFNADVLSSANRFVISKFTTSTQREYLLELLSGSVSMALCDTSNSSNRITINHTTGVTFETGRWYHIAFTYDGSGTTEGADIYVDGVLASTATKTKSLGYVAMGNKTAPLKIGERSGKEFDGKISNVVLWNSDQSSEISNIYNSGVPATSYTNTPTAWYKLDQSANWEADTSGAWQIPDAVSAYPQSFDFNGLRGADGNPKQEIIAPNVSQGQNFTFSCWANFNNPTANLYHPLITVYSGSTSVIELIKNRNASNANQVYFTVRNTLNNRVLVFSNVVPTANEWCHVAGTYDGSNVTIYFNGVAGQSLPQTGDTIASAPIEIGSYYYWNTTYGANFDGQISNVQYFDTALPATGSNSIETLYNNGTPLTTAIASDNLKAWYKLNDNEKFDGTNWSVENQKYPANWESALSFDGTNAVDVSTISFDMTNNLTLSCWINPKGFSTWDYLCTRGGAGGANSALNFRFSSSGRLYSSYLGSSLNTAVVFPTNQWSHLAITFNYSNGDVIFYKNGVQTGNTLTFANGYATAELSNIGDVNGTGSSGMNSLISNFAVWESLQDISELYNNGTPALSYTNTPTAWWKLDNLNTGLIDNGTGGNNATNVGTIQTNTFVSTEAGTSSGMTEQNLVNNNVSALNGESNGMTSANLVLSDLTRAVPYDSYSLNFDSGSSDYIDTGASSFSGLTEISVSAWVKPTATGTGAAESILSTEAASPNRGFYLSLFILNEFRWQVSTDGSNKDSLDGGTISLNEWTHIVATWNQSTMNLYVNGALADTMSTVNATGTFSTTNNMFIGQRVSGAGYFPGNISNVSIFNEELTSTEVLKLYANGVPQDLSNFTPAPVAWYPLGSNSFWNGSQWIVRDMSTGGSNDGTGQNIGVDGLVGDAPRSEANGTGTNMDVPSNLEGSTKWSSNNSWSINMSSTARVEDTP